MVLLKLKHFTKRGNLGLEQSSKAYNEEGNTDGQPWPPPDNRAVFRAPCEHSWEAVGEENSEPRVRAGADGGSAWIRQQWKEQTVLILVLERRCSSVRAE